mgnify:FL=1
MTETDALEACAVVDAENSPTKSCVVSGDNRATIGDTVNQMCDADSVVTSVTIEDIYVNNYVGTTNNVCTNDDWIVCVNGKDGVPLRVARCVKKTRGSCGTAQGLNHPNCVQQTCDDVDPQTGNMLNGQSSSCVGGCRVPYGCCDARDMGHSCIRNPTSTAQGMSVLSVGEVTEVCPCPDCSSRENPINDFTFDTGLCLEGSGFSH